MSATLVVEPYRLLPDAKRIVIDCRHGETSVVFMPSEALALSDTALARMALSKHYSEERCRCTRRLRKRLGVEGTR